MIGRKIDVLDLGFVRLVDAMPHEVDRGDTRIAEFARNSDVRAKQKNSDAGLIEHLIRHRHTSPIEGPVFLFHCKMPMSTARQWVRHRTASLNEQSTRYTEVDETKDGFYMPVPERYRTQDMKNRQGSSETPINDVEAAMASRLRVRDFVFQEYRYQVHALGVARELARDVLGLATYTQWYWQINLHNLFHFLGLRDEPHAQFEIRQYAKAMIELITPYVPFAVASWEKWRAIDWAMRNTVVDLLQEYVDPASSADSDKIVRALLELYRMENPYT